MRAPSPVLVRGGRIGVVALLFVMFLAPAVSAQFPPRPQIPQPRPPVMPQMPQPPRINFPQIPQPNFPNLPNTGIPGMGGPQFPDLPRPGGGVGGFGGFENVYYCKKCNTELGRGIAPPTSATCRCGLTYNNGVAWDDGRNRFNPGIGQPFNPNPNPGIGQPVKPEPVNAPNVNLPVDNGQPFNPPVVIDTPDPAPTPAVAPVVLPKSSNRTLVVIGGIVLGLLVILGMILAVMYVKANQKQRVSQLRRRRA